MVKKPECRYKQILDASANWCNLYREAVNDTNKCQNCPNYKKLM